MIVGVSVSLGIAGLIGAQPATADPCNIRPSLSIDGGTSAGEDIVWEVNTGGATCRAAVDVLQDGQSSGERLVEGIVRGTLTARCDTTYVLRVQPSSAAIKDPSEATLRTPVWPALAASQPDVTSFSYTSADLTWTWPGREGGDRCAKASSMRLVVSDGQSIDVGPATTARVTGLTAGTTYSVNVLVDGGKSSPTTTFMTLSQIAPNVPANLVGASRSQSSVALNWDAPEDDGGATVTGYEISWTGGNQSVTGSSTVITGLKANTRYVFTVKARNAIGLGPGVLVAVTTGQEPPAPAPAPTKATGPVITPDGGNGDNIDGSHDADGDPTTIAHRLNRNVTWPSVVLKSGKPQVLVRTAALKTNAGSQATIRVTKKSASVAKASIIRKDGKVSLRATLKPGARSGFVIVSAQAPSKPGFEALQSSHRYRVAP
jgi:hypothetical protein